MTRRYLPLLLIAIGALSYIQLYPFSSSASESSISARIVPSQVFEGAPTIYFSFDVVHGDWNNLHGNTGSDMRRAVEMGLMKSFQNMSWIEIKSKMNVPLSEIIEADGVLITYKMSVFENSARNGELLGAITSQIHRPRLKKSYYQYHIAVPFIFSEAKIGLAKQVESIAHLSSRHLAHAAQCAHFADAEHCRPIPKPFTPKE